MKATRTLFVLLFAAICAHARGEDFNQWRGPRRDGVTTTGPAVAACLELATGKVAWEEKTTHRGVRSPVLADGKIFTSDGTSILVVRATPQKYELLAKAKMPIGQYASPTVCDGRLYLRQNKNVASYDLTRPAATTAPADERK